MSNAASSMTESKITRKVLADLQVQIYILITIVQAMTVQLFPSTNDVYVEVDDAESKEEDNLDVYDDPVYDEYEYESEEDLCKEIYAPPIIYSYDDDDGDVPMKDTVDRAALVMFATVPRSLQWFRDLRIFEISVSSSSVRYGL
ncbi:hypothetical protein DY000_02016178 [Brassica cretica]|uniref:Uncharacterized protein n=1 Tax=Brassica cretica TaxID=69181 RepID=A0ABQ7CVB1_BRACR|nr:hypothetical protein DY000_02016178 [Brassica cretica]